MIAALGLKSCPNIAIIIVQEGYWRALTETCGVPEMAEDPRFRTNLARIERMREVDDLVAEWTRGCDRDELFERLVSANVPCAPVRGLNEVLEDRHLSPGDR